MKALWREYCLKSTLHGLRYVAEVEKSIYEKFVWSCLLTLATVFVFYHLLACWTLFSAAPTQITIDNPRYPISKIDFPAVTVCPINKVMYSKALNLYQEYSAHNVSATSFMNSMLVLSLMRYPFYNQILEFIFNENPDLYRVRNENIKNMMLEVMPNIDEIFSHCFWRGHRYNCTELLRLQRTEEGFCYSFNSKTAERFSYVNSSRTPPFMNVNRKLVALRNNAAGKISGFEFVLRSLDNEYLPGDRRMKGYNVMVHNPDDFPDVSSGFMVYTQYRKVFRIGMTATIVVADESLDQLTQKQRGCHIELDEKDGHQQSQYPRQLQHHFSRYARDSENNCYAKCRLKYIYDICHCTPYFFRLYDATPYCGMQHIYCLAVINVLQRNYLAPPGEEGFPAWSLPMHMNCSCLQPCSFISYHRDIRATYSDIIYGENHSLYIDVMYDKLFAVKYKRFLKYNAQDILVSFGGVASLFLGCSIISVAEFVYYAIQYTFYLFYNYIHCAPSKRLLNVLLKWMKKIIAPIGIKSSSNITKKRKRNNSVSIYPYLP